MPGNIKIGLFGFGCVGQGLYHVLQQQDQPLFHIEKIVVKDKHKPRSIALENFSFEKNEILHNDAIPIVVELIDDAGEAYRIVKEALLRGKSVVTANKKMLAEHRQELLQLQQPSGGSLLYEASCCGSIPVIRLLDEYFSKDEIKDISGIFNGTSNFVLTKMFEEHLEYKEAIKLAQEKGFAETDPHLDVSGKDAASKLAIITTQAFGTFVTPRDIFTIGIENVTPFDIIFAQKHYSKIKLVATAEMHQDEITLSVAPRFIPRGHLLYQVDEEFNAVQLETQFAGSHFFKGRGAGSIPTGAAVAADLASIARGSRYEIRKQSKTLSSGNPSLVYEVYVRVHDVRVFDKLKFKSVAGNDVGLNLSTRTGWLTQHQMKEAWKHVSQDGGIIIFTGRKTLQEQLHSSRSFHEILALN